MRYETFNLYPLPPDDLCAGHASMDGLQQTDEASHPHYITETS